MKVMGVLVVPFRDFQFLRCCFCGTFKGINKVDIYHPSTRAFPSRSLELPRNFMTSLQKRLRNGASRQSSNGRNFNRQPSKKAKFCPSTVKKGEIFPVNRQKRRNFSRQPSKKQLLLDVKWFEGVSNFSISAAHLGLRALKESF